MTDKIVVLTTCETEEEAARIAETLVGSRLAACVNVLPGMKSVYRWKGAVESARELLLLIKTSRELLSEVQAAIEKIHSYEVPECIALPVVDGSATYLEWLEHGLRQNDSPPR